MATPDDRTVAETIPTSGGHPVTLGKGSQVGRYVIIGVLGRGGMGVVYAAYDPNLDRQVALKLLHDEVRADELVREAQALAKLDDPHVVTVFDAGELDGHGFVAMQLVDGEDLATALATRKPSAPQVLSWFVDAGRGLAAAHAAGLIHRDFKPSNVLIDKRGRVAVTDFGLARSMTATAEDSGLTNVAAGTPAYMAPEQHGMEHASPASDQFAFCVATWEALFGQHPFIREARETMSPFAIGHAIFDGTLIPPPRSTVPRRVVDALTRGLARAPAERWPSMIALLDVLAPPPRRRVWPFVIGGIATAALGGGAVWALGGERDPGPSCGAIADERVAAVWSPATGQQIAARFARSGRSYASVAAAQAVRGLDRYATTWRQLASDACTAEQLFAATELAPRRRACLDARLDAMRGLVGLLVAEERAEFVDHAQAMVDGLPDLAACTDTASLLAGPGAVPSLLEARVQPVERELATAIARGNGGDYEAARTMLALAAGHAEAIGWAPLVARAHLAYGEQQLLMHLPARDELSKAAELATATHLDREAAAAWADLLRAVADDRSRDAVAAILPMARGAAARLGDPVARLHADIAYGVALSLIGRAKEASDLCRTSLKAARDLGSASETDSARECLIAGLTLQGAWAELDPILRTRLADVTGRFGAVHPLVADCLQLISSFDEASGKLAEAHVEAQRALEIRQRAFPPRHLRIAESLERLAELADANQPSEADKLYRQALEIAREVKPAPVILIAQIDEALGYLAYRTQTYASAFALFDEAVALVRDRFGSNTMELAIILLNYGQLKSVVDFDAGSKLLAEAQAILDHAHDRRAVIAGAALGFALVRHERFAEARALLENELDHVAESDLDEYNVAKVKFALAQALAGSHGDPRRAHALAAEALQTMTRLGVQQAMIDHVRAWLAQHP